MPIDKREQHLSDSAGPRPSLAEGSDAVGEPALVEVLRTVKRDMLENPWGYGICAKLAPPGGGRAQDDRVSDAEIESEADRQLAEIMADTLGGLLERFPPHLEKEAVRAIGGSYGKAVNKWRKDCRVIQSCRTGMRRNPQRLPEPPRFPAEGC